MSTIQLVLQQVWPFDNNSWLQRREAEQLMQAWIGHIQGLMFYMEQFGVEVSNQDKILTLTMWLPPSYNPTIINFNAISSEVLTLNNVNACLLNKEVQQSSDSNVVKDSEDKAMVATDSEKGGHGAQNTVLRTHFCTGRKISPSLTLATNLTRMCYCARRKISPSLTL